MYIYITHTFIYKRCFTLSMENDLKEEIAKECAEIDQIVQPVEDEPEPLDEVAKAKILQTIKGLKQDLPTLKGEAWRSCYKRINALRKMVDV